jgi:hypothetical protein
MQSQLIIIWPADNKVQHGAKDKQHALRSSSTSHLRETEQDRDGTSSMHCNPDRHNISTGHKGTRPRRDVPQWPALACLPNSATPAAFRQRQIILHSLFAFSVSVSVYLCLSPSPYIYLSISVYITILSYLYQLSSFILIITISLTLSLLFPINSPTIPPWSRGKAFGTCIPDTQAPCIRAGDRHILYTAGECDGGQSPTCTADNRSKRLFKTGSAQLESRQLN